MDIQKDDITIKTEVFKSWIKFKIVKTKNIFCIFTLKEVEQANLFRVCYKNLRYRNKDHQFLFKFT